MRFFISVDMQKHRKVSEVYFSVVQERSALTLPKWGQNKSKSFRCPQLGKVRALRSCTTEKYTLETFRFFLHIDKNQMKKHRSLPPHHSAIVNNFAAELLIRHIASHNSKTLQ